MLYQNRGHGPRRVTSMDRETVPILKETSFDVSLISMP